MDKRCEDLLLQYVQESWGTGRRQLEESLWAEFGATKAVLVMDLSRFSILTERNDIVYNLAMINRSPASPSTP